MSSSITKLISGFGRRAAQQVGRTAGASVDTFQRNPTAATLQQTSRLLAQSQQGRVVMGAMRAVASGPVLELSKICGRAGVAGAVIDGAMGGHQAYKFMRNGTIDGTQAARHVVAETGCGFVTSASGTAGTIAVYMVTGSMGPAAMVVGMGASMGSRMAYRKIVGDTLPAGEPAGQPAADAEAPPARAEDDIIEEIGPQSGD